MLGRMIESTPESARSRLAEDGYAYLPDYLSPAAVERRALDVQDVLWRNGWINADGETLRTPLREDEDEYAQVYDEVYRVESFHDLAHEMALLELLDLVLDNTTFPHPLKIARLGFPDNLEATTPAHQDFPSNQGTPDLVAAWLPLHVPHDSGLAVLAGSHRHGIFPRRRHLGAGNREAIVPWDVRQNCAWVTADYRPGDVLLFGSHTVHAARPNESRRMRLSVDYRYQREGDALCEHALLPHFRRQSWEQVYEGWSPDGLQHYWHGLDYEVVPFDTRYEDALPAVSDEDLQRVAAYDERRAAMDVRA